MLSLRELQQRFIAAILAAEGADEASAALTPLVGDHGLPALQRLQIYRNNCRLGFRDALAAGYPVLRRLVGEAYFDQLSDAYREAHPSPSGNLAHVGAALPAFLERRFAGGDYDYFAHVARLEWACQECLLAADSRALDLERLAAVSPADYGRLRFELHPATRLVSSTWPVITIWEAHQREFEPPTIDLAAGGEQGLVQRPAMPGGSPAEHGESIAIFRLPAAEFAALRAFRDARSLEAAVGDALELDPDFDLRAALRRWTHHGFLAGFSVVGATMDI
jgi:hypothetical protein